MPIPMRVATWESDALWQLTPVEHRGDLYFKRDDLYDADSAGVVNGTKLRQAMHLIGEAKKAGAQAVVSAASVKSPQHALAAWAGCVHGLPVHQIIGATNSKAAAKHPSVAIAAMLGARFYHSQVAYNPVLQRAAGALQNALTDSYQLPYAIGAGHNMEAWRKFHAVGAHQVKNIPEHIETLLIPFGSGNSTASILYGLHQHPLPDLKSVVLFGVGPNRLIWLWNRLQVLLGTTRFPFSVIHHSLHDEGFATYQTAMPYSYHGLDMHPTYEGKCFHYMESHSELWEQYIRPSSLFWIVGSELNTQRAAKILGIATPTQIPLNALPNMEVANAVHAEQGTLL